MEKPNLGPEFLDKKDPQLAGSAEVKKSVEIARRRGEKFPDKRKDRLNVHLERLENIFLNPDERVRKRNLKMLLPAIHEEFIIDREDVPEAFFDLQKRIARKRGQTVEEDTVEAREATIDTIIADQKRSLDNWVEYLTSNDATYPPAFKYFVFKNIVKLSQFDKKLGIFKTREDNTTANFPDIYREPLAKIADIYVNYSKIIAQEEQELTYLKKQLETLGLENREAQQEKIQAQQEKILEIRGTFSKKFPELYAELTQKSLAASIENREEIKGRWVRYSQGNDGDAQKLYSSIENKGTGWCTAGKSTAETQIKGGDFYVYYTNDKTGEPVQPRLAIRMEGKGRISEVRGILQGQGVEKQMSKTLDEKLSGFGAEADRYKKKSADMELLTEIEEKVKENPQTALTKDELQFIYEIDSFIEGFGWERDPRIEEIRKARNIEEDLPIIFECTQAQIATAPESVNESTVMYVGQWSLTILNQIKPHLSHITNLYESFPDKQIFHRNLETDPTLTADISVQKMSKAPFSMSDYAKNLLAKTEFSKSKERYELVAFSVAQLGFPEGATTDQIYARAESSGLKLCPAEIGPQLRLQYTNQPKGEWLRVAMKQLIGRVGQPALFRMCNECDDFDLDEGGAQPGLWWTPNERFVFCVDSSGK